jgi:hypothetical protein
MNTHQLINENDPLCLFCGGQCYVSGDGQSPNLYTDHYNCIECSESFSIHRYDSDPPYAFDFTCGKLLVIHMYQTDRLVIRRWDTITTDASDDNPITIPYFEIDFADKQALIDKLTVYLTFA